MTADLADKIALLEALEQKHRQRAAKSLGHYCRYIDIPGAPINDEEDCEEFYIDSVTPAEHHDLLNEKLEALVAPESDFDILLVFMPPGSAKSTYGTVTFPTWWMGNNPGEPVICASYGSDLAKKFGRKCRQITSSDKYRELFGCELTPGNRAADDWSLTNDATYMAGGILSGMTGNRAKLLVIDDPVKGRQDADSPTVRENTWNAYQDDLLSRLKPGGKQLIIQTRWHEDDLSGRILPEDWDGETGYVTTRNGDRAYVLCLEAECTREDDPLGREIGEFLWTDWFPVERWQSEKRQGSRRWASLYQQRPRPMEGSLILRNWIRRYTEFPAEFLRIVQSWDTAYKDSEINDPTVCTTWGETRHGYYLLDVYREKVAYPDLKRHVCSMALKWNPQAILIEDKSSGQSLIQELREGVEIEEEIDGVPHKRLFTPPVVAMDPQGVNKVDRLVAVSSMFEAGLVYLPDVRPWLVDYEVELFAFPLSTNDDQVDSTSQFLKWAHASRVTVDHHAIGHRRAGLEADRGQERGGRDEDPLDLGVSSSNSFGGFI